MVYTVSLAICNRIIHFYRKLCLRTIVFVNTSFELVFNEKKFSKLFWKKCQYWLCLKSIIMTGSIVHIELRQLWRMEMLFGSGYQPGVNVFHSELLWSLNFKFYTLFFVDKYCSVISFNFHLELKWKFSILCKV